MGVNAIAKAGKLELENAENPEKAGNTKNAFSQYIKDNIWDKWDSGLRDFMLKTSIVDEMTEELALALTGRGDAGAILRELCAQNSFVSSSGNSGPSSESPGEATYRYHSLFLGFLRNVLQDSSIDQAALNKVAAEYYLARQQHFVASHYAVNSNDIQVLMRTFHRFFHYSSPSLSEHLHFLKILLSADSLPEATREQYPFLYVGMVFYAYQSGDAERVGYYTDKLLAHINTIASDYPQFLEAAIEDTFLDHRIPLPAMLKRSKTLPPIVQKGETIQMPTITNQRPFMHRGGKATDPGALEKASAPYWDLFGEQYKVFYPCLKSGMYLEKNMLPEALSFAEEAVGLLDSVDGISPEFIFSAHMHLAAVHRAMGNDELAMQIVGNTKNKLDEMNAGHLNHNLMAYQAMLRLWDGDRAAAQEWLDNYFVTKFDRLPAYKEFQHYTTARAHMVLGNVDEAMSCILELERFSRDFRRPTEMAESGTLKAALEWAMGKHKEAVATLETVLAILQPHGYLRIVADEGAAVEPILKRIAAKVDKKGYDGILTKKFVNDTLLIAHGVAKKYKGITANIIKNTKQIKLSKQQKKMIELLAAGHHNQKIAEITGLTVHTVKLHLSLAYKKLGVHNAIDAVLKARELGLIK
jgi:LuxR family maltose regulon positive regulatory protein